LTEELVFTGKKFEKEETLLLGELSQILLKLRLDLVSAREINTKLSFLNLDQKNLKILKHFQKGLSFI
jgi:hypothetical protein